MKLKVTYRGVVDLEFEEDIDCTEEESDAIVEDLEIDIDRLVQNTIVNGLDGNVTKINVKRKKFKIDEI